MYRTDKVPLIAMGIVGVLLAILLFVAFNPFGWGWLSSNNNCGSKSNPCYMPVIVPTYHYPINPPEDGSDN